MHYYHQVQFLLIVLYLCLQYHLKLRTNNKRQTKKNEMNENVHRRGLEGENKYNVK
jgi:preprotein translocase subunit YajC